MQRSASQKYHSQSTRSRVPKRHRQLSNLVASRLSHRDGDISLDERPHERVAILSLVGEKGK
jgi:hypothetical protein